MGEYETSYESGLTARKTYITIPEPENVLEVICGEEVIITTWKDLFDALGSLLSSDEVSANG